MKTALSVFPAVRVPFRARVEGSERELRLESYACACRGPERPHEHWFIAWPGLQRGHTVTFTPQSDGTFEVTIER